MKKYLLVISILAALSYSHINSISLKSFYSYFSNERFEEVEQKEIPVGARHNLKLEHINGPIQIQTWQQPTILLKATKHAAKQELLPQISISVHSSNDAVSIKTVYGQDALNGSADYHLLVPASLNITVATDSSNINIDHITGAVTVNSQNGNVSLHAIQGPIDIAIANKGSIVIEQPGNVIKATTHLGNIDILDAKKNLFASTDNGKIKSSCKAVPSGSVIKLDATGPIALQLPSGINADIQAETEQKDISCDHYVTIKPFITQLNNKAWSQFKRSVNGTLGTGQSQICLHSVAGNIKITKPVA